jgi:hypothetical protein
MSAAAPGFIASGNINPSVAVKLDTTAGANFHVLQCAAATDRPLGIAQDGTYYAPGIAGSDGFAAHTGQEITVFGEGEQCLWKVGVAGVTQGDYLKSDANGDAVTVAFTLGAGTIWATAIALEAANAGELVRVVIKIQALTDCTA